MINYRFYLGIVSKNQTENGLIFSCGNLVHIFFFHLQILTPKRLFVSRNVERAALSQANSGELILRFQCISYGWMAFD